MTAKKKFYAVAKGRKPGIYQTWPETLEQVNHFSGAVYKSFPSLPEAETWLKNPKFPSSSRAKTNKKSVSSPSKQAPLPLPTASADCVIIYTDGGALSNPGPGGYGAVLLYNEHRKELSGGFRRTTNNRMELMACIMALRSLTISTKPIVLHSDSAYVVNGFEKGWVKGWKKRGWKKADLQPVANVDLWQELSALVDQCTITFKWVKGHAGNPLNERCDQLAGESAAQTDLPPDMIYESLNQLTAPAA